MAEEMCAHGDIVEQILTRLDVDDLIQCKRVCKSWLSLISDPFFVKTHLIHSYNKDRKNNESRRIVMNWSPYGIPYFLSMTDPISKYCILGSSNGLLCLFTTDVTHLLIANPSTRQVKHLPRPPIVIPHVTLLFGGFGYDFLMDDYKVILGNKTCFQVLSLKSNVWKVIQFEYSFISTVGILWNRSLHWFMKDHNNKVVIVSFDLSKEKFEEIPQPNDSYQWYWYHRLGIINECLSICGYYVPSSGDKIWIMNNYNDKKSWELLPRDFEAKRQLIHALIEPDELQNCNIPCESDKSFGQYISEIHSHRYTCALIFVRSLVSPISR